MNAPAVSAVIPVYNRQRYLGPAIESIRAQHYQPLEIIVVDDGSTDGSAEVAKSYSGLSYVRQEHQGVAAARNRGLTVARGDLVAFLDSDDLWTENKLQIQVQYLVQHPEVDYVVAKMRNFVDIDCAEAPVWMASSAFEKSTLGIPTLVAWKYVFDRVGMFDTTYEVGEDIDWFLRAKDSKLAMRALEDVLLMRRIHDSNLCCRPVEEQKQVMARVLRASMDRKRRQREEMKLS